MSPPTENVTSNRQHVKPVSCPPELLLDNTAATCTWTVPSRSPSRGSTRRRPTRIMKPGPGDMRNALQKGSSQGVGRSAVTRPSARDNAHAAAALPGTGILTGHTNWVHSVAFSPDGKTLASGSGDQTVRLWDVATGRQIGKPLTGHTDFVTSVAYSSDGKTLASGSDDGTVRLWDVATGHQMGKRDRAAACGRVSGGRVQRRRDAPASSLGRPGDLAGRPARPAGWVR
jgi:WD40 repeat protein